MARGIATGRMAMSIARCLGLAAASLLLFSFEFAFASAAHARGLRSAAPLAHEETSRTVE